MSTDADMKFADLTHAERMAALMRELSSPKSVDSAQVLLAQIKQEYGEALSAYKMLARRHGVKEKPLEFGSESEAKKAGPSDSKLPTLGDAIRSYINHPNSPVHGLRFLTRKSYNVYAENITDEIGDRKLVDLEAKDIEAFYQFWMKDGKKHMALAKVNALRRYFSFGASVLEDRECARLSAIMHNMRFDPVTARDKQLTREQVEAIIKKAHELGYPGIALAQALQFECPELRQKDIIGEWIPRHESGPLSDITDPTNGFRWVRGIRWNEINKNLILRHTKSWDQKEVEIDLKRAGLVMQELELKKPFPSSGAVVTKKAKDGSELPFVTVTFQGLWRKIAKAANVPSDLRFADSRRGGAAETDDEDDSENEQAAGA